MYPFIVPQSKYLPAKLCPINFRSFFIKDRIASVIWISPPLPDFCIESFLKIILGKIYLPITALLDGASFMDGFSMTSLIIKLFLLIFFFNLINSPS